jgi:hypothetical protein
MRFMGAALALAVIFASPLLAQEQAAPDYPPPPAFIAERIADGRFEPGNFEYLRGYFPEASAAQKAQYADLQAWLDECEARGAKRMDAALAALGVAMEADKSFIMAGAANECQQVVTGEAFKDFASYDELAEAMRGARLVFDALVHSVALAKQRSQPLEPDLGADLHHRTLDDQMLRSAYKWGWGEVTDERTPKLNAKERTSFIALLNSEILFVDYQNREWLKQVVAENGWPTISQVGKRGAFAAWLLTQHADMDPAFQWEALSLMEPLLETGEALKRNYAYLYDRTTLKLDAKQRYATQLRCYDGKWILRPLEEPERVDELRAEMGLEPLADYLAGFSVPCGG